MNLTVVVDIETNKLIPFTFADNGEIIITSSGVYDEEKLTVKSVDSKLIDWEKNKLITVEEFESNLLNTYFKIPGA